MIEVKLESSGDEGTAEWGYYAGERCLFVDNEPYTPESDIVVTSASLCDAIAALKLGYAIDRRAVTEEE